MVFLNHCDCVIIGNKVLGHPNVELQDFLENNKQTSCCSLLVKPSISLVKTNPFYNA